MPKYVPTEAEILAANPPRKKVGVDGYSSRELNSLIGNMVQGHGKPPTQLRRLKQPNGRVIFLPETYSNERPIQLQAPQMEDTSDRSLATRARTARASPVASRAPTDAEFRAAELKVAEMLEAAEAAGREGTSGGIDGDGDGGGGGGGDGGGGGGGGGITTLTMGDAGEKLAKLMNFDAEGFNKDIGLQKDMFYWSPFMTCAKCNTMAIIDSVNARSYASHSHVPTAVAREMRPEPLPRCHVCGSTQDWWMGSHDLLKLIAGSRKELKAKLKAQRRSAKKIQRAFRFYLRRARGRAERNARQIRYMLEFRASSVMEAVVRGRLGRRKAHCTKSLRIIQRAHNKLLQRALTDRTYKRKCFWYKPDQVKILYQDYVLLAERTGFQPARVLVEENIHEIARRIRIRESYLCTLIQKKWRGISARKFLIIYRREFTRVKEIRCGAAFRVQRLFRGWVGRKLYENLIIAKAKAKAFGGYLYERMVYDENKDVAARRTKLGNYYTDERMKERSARVTGLVHPGAAGGNKMQAFNESAYGTSAGEESVAFLMTSLGMKVKEIRQREEGKVEAKKNRGEFVRVEQMQGRAKRLYYADEVKQRTVDIIEKLTTEMPVRDTHAMLSRHNARGDKFKYPAEIYVDPTEALWEGEKIKKRPKRARRRRGRGESSNSDSSMAASASAPSLPNYAPTSSSSSSSSSSSVSSASLQSNPLQKAKMDAIEKDALDALVAAN